MDYKDMSLTQLQKEFAKIKDRIDGRYFIARRYASDEIEYLDETFKANDFGVVDKIKEWVKENLDGESWLNLNEEELCDFVDTASEGVWFGFNDGEIECVYIA